MTETTRFVAYYRMPAAGSRRHGSELARQKTALGAFLDRPDRMLVGEFTDVARRGPDEALPAFDRAVECCRNLGATLVAALSEGELRDDVQCAAQSAGVDLLLIEPAAVTRPAESEPVGSEPVVSGDRPADVPYLPLGSRRGFPPPPRTASRRPAGNRGKADAFARAILPIIEQIRASGATSLTDIADALNARQVRTARGRRWHAATVRNILNRARAGRNDA